MPKYSSRWRSEQPARRERVEVSKERSLAPRPHNTSRIPVAVQAPSVRQEAAGPHPAHSRPCEKRADFRISNKFELVPLCEVRRGHRIHITPLNLFISRRLAFIIEGNCASSLRIRCVDGDSSARVVIRRSRFPSRSRDETRTGTAVMKKLSTSPWNI